MKSAAPNEPRREKGGIRLPSPGVAFGRDYLTRVERLVPRIRAARERREGPGRGGMSGGGLEFTGFRPYRSGESLRGIDWGLYARLDRPFVRLARREASERWAILLDTSASMGVGVPGKLQTAAEIAGAFASLGLAHGAEVRILAGAEAVSARKPTDFPRVLELLGGLVAAGADGLATVVREPARFRSAGRVFAIGDLLDLEPRHLLGPIFAGRRGRELCCVQLLAPAELSADGARPGALGDESVVWIDPETGERRPMTLSRTARAAYEAALGRRLTAWGTACARHRAAYGTWPSTVPFEDVCNALLGA
jgi:uncharacterized protein (DUF58 family)